MAYITNRDPWLEIAKGNVSGSRSYTIIGKKDEISQVGLDDLNEVPNGLVIEEPAGIQLELVSSSANDTGAGTGARTIRIVYIDSNGDMQTENVTLNGTTPVNTVATNIAFIQWICVSSAGSNNYPAGNISLRNTAGTTTYDYIVAGGNQSNRGTFTVPTGHKGYITGWNCSSIKKCDVRLRATCFRDDRSLNLGVFHFQDATIQKDSANYREFKASLEIPAGATVKLSAIGYDANSDAIGSFDIVIIQD